MKTEINEVRKASEKEASYKGICGLIYGYAIGFTFVLSGMAIALIAAVIGQIIDGRPTAEEIIKSGFYAYYSVLFALAANFVRQIFRRLKISDTPFKYDIADKMKGLGYIVSGGGTAGALIFSLVGLFTNSAKNDVFGLSLAFGAGMMVVGLIIIVFALIFEQGCKLQQESDETL